MNAAALRLATAALALTAASGPAAAQRAVADRLDDLRLATAVRLALVADARTRTADVEVSALGGVVDLTGTTAESIRATLVAVARNVGGVRAVRGLGAGDAPAAPSVPIAPRPAPSPTAPAGAAYHTVRPGDTLFSLARRYETTVEAIRQLNGLASSQIDVGQRLRIR